MQPSSWSPEIVEIGERIGNLTLAKAVQLRDHLEQVYGLQTRSFAMPQLMPDVVIDSVPAEPSTFDIVLESVDPARRIAAMKQVRESAGLALKEAKQLVEGAPSVLKQGLAKAQAEQLKALLETSGAKVLLRPSPA